MTELDRQEPLVLSDRPAPAQRVIVAHGEPLLCQSLAASLAEQDRLEVVAAIRRADDLHDAVDRHQPDVMLVAMGDTAFRAAVGALRDRHPSLPVIGLVAEADGDGAAQALASGVAGLVPTTASAARVRAALAAVTGGWIVLPHDYRDVLTGVSRARMRIAELTPDERALLELVVDGHTVSEMARRLYVSDRTVKRRVSALLDRMGCRSRVDLATVYGGALLDGHPPT